MPPGSCNPFGIKARSGDPFVEVNTREIRNGEAVIEPAKFRKFANFDEAFSYHGRLLATSPSYRTAMAVANDPIAFCNALTGVYATDEDYGKKLVNIINEDDLTAYDKRQSSGAASLEKDQNAMALKFGDVGENVRSLQQALKVAGYSVGAIDGKFGSLTRAAVAAFQGDNSLSMTGAADPDTMTLLNRAPQRPLDPDRREATEEDLKKKGSVTVTEAGKTKMLGWVSGILGLLGIGNSAAVNIFGSGTSSDPTQPITDLLSQIQKALSGTGASVDSTQLNQLAQKASDLIAALKGGGPKLAQLAAELQSSIPTDFATQHPDFKNLLSLLTAAGNVHAGVPRTILDWLPGAADGGLVSGIATIVASLIPGFGGSAVALIGGVLAHYFAGRIADARVQDHRDASNTNR
jgi:hypothetical protein